MCNIFLKMNLTPPPLTILKKLQYWLDMAFLMQNSVINSSFQPCWQYHPASFANKTGWIEMKKVGDIFQKILLSISFSCKEKQPRSPWKIDFETFNVFYSSNYLKAKSKYMCDFFNHLFFFQQLRNYLLIHNDSWPQDRIGLRTDCFKWNILCLLNQ